MDFTICVVGMGLMGASTAQALKGFRNARIVGVDIDETVCETARINRMADECTTDITEGVAGADLIIFCVYARHIPGLLKQCADAIKKGCVITDICGVKHKLYEHILPMVPAHAAYIGVHPMAGRERDGILNADATLFKGTGFILCPTPKTTPHALQLLEELAVYIGCARIVQANYQLHDELIAYSSDLMHISAAALCHTFPDNLNLAFTAGAFRDSTRVADINAAAWTELLLDNRENVLHQLDHYLLTLGAMRAAIHSNNAETLEQILQQCGDNKREMLKR